MDDELTILALYGLWVALTLLAQSTGALSQLGMGYVLSARDDPRELTGIAGRLERALNNSVVALALFAPPILILAVRDAFDANSLLAAQVFLAARVAYVPLYALGIIGLRTLVWLAGFAATVVLYFLAL
ncbi:MAG: MAPEG family protein [Alphaproteobacteria bacterium]|nr:MAG: MAPEG family protein [Alphaproteobacteria bacterium]